MQQTIDDSKTDRTHLKTSFASLQDDMDQQATKLKTMVSRDEITSIVKEGFAASDIKSMVKKGFAETDFKSLVRGAFAESDIKSVVKEAFAESDIKSIVKEAFAESDVLGSIRNDLDSMKADIQDLVRFEKARGGKDEGCWSQ